MKPNIEIQQQWIITVFILCSSQKTWWIMQLIVAKNFLRSFQLDGQTRVTGWPISTTGWPIGHPVNMSGEALPRYEKRRVRARVKSQTINIQVMKVSWPLKDLWPFKLKVEKCIFKYFCTLENQQYLAKIIGKTSPWSVPKIMADTLTLFEMLKCTETICISVLIWYSGLYGPIGTKFGRHGSFCIACWMLYRYFQIQITLHGLTWPDLIWPDD